MKTHKLYAVLTASGLLMAAPVLAQPAQTPHQQPAFQNPGGVAGGFASATDKDAATKQNTQNLTPSSNEDALEKGKQK
jgi:hypothetical protein